MTAAVQLEGVHKSFEKIEVLRGIDLEVAEHEVICLIGASGSGKSTLLRCVNLLEPIDAGRIHVHGVEVTAPGSTILERGPADEKARRAEVTALITTAAITAIPLILPTLKRVGVPAGGAAAAIFSLLQSKALRDLH